MKLRKILAGAMAVVMAASSLLVTPVETKAAEADTATGLVGYYTFDDTLKNEVSENGVALQKGGGAVDATIGRWLQDPLADPTYAAGKEGKSFVFTGDGEKRGDGLQLDVTTGETGSFTISMWVKTAEKVNFQPVFFTNLDHLYYVQLDTLINDYDSAVRTSHNSYWNYLDKNQKPGTATTEGLIVNDWVYVTYTFAADGTVTLYTNGVMLDKDTVKTTDGVVATDLSQFKKMPIFLGINWWDKTFEGEMDEVTVYHRALSADDVAALYAKNGVPQIPVSTITLDATEKNLTVGGEFTLSTTTAPSYANVEPTITWTSSDATVAKVENGKVTALKAGTATITASVSDTVKATCTVNVAAEKKPLTGIEATAGKTELKYGDETTITVALTPVDTTDVVIATYKSSNDKVVTVDANGKVVAVGAGEATVTVTAGTFTDDIKFTVDDKTEVKLDDLTSTTWWDNHTAGIKIEEGRTYTFNFDVKTSDNSKSYYGMNYVVYTGTEAKVNGGGYTELFVGRSDNYGWIGAKNTAEGLPEGYTYKVNKTYEESKWLTDYAAALKAGSKGTLTATMDDGTLIVVLEVEGAKNTLTYKASKDVPTYISLFAEKATLSNITVAGQTTPASSVVEKAGDFDMVLPLVLVFFGGAVVLVASKKRFA